MSLVWHVLAHRPRGKRRIKAALAYHVYQSEQLAEARRASTGLIEALFQTFLANPNLLPANYLEESAGEPPHRQVCDYIAGMTDRYLIRHLRTDEARLNKTAQLLPRIGV